MIECTVLAYLAGAMDSDGSFGIKKSTYRQRVRKDAGNATYSERLMLKQVTPEIPHLLKECFGGRLVLEKPSCEGTGKPLWSWQCTDKLAAEACRQLMPYIRVKKRQSEILLELRESKDSKYWQVSYWFALEYPDWQNMELITTSQASRILEYSKRETCSQAIKNGTLLALPYHNQGKEVPRIPKLLVEQIEAISTGKNHRRPKQLIEWRERLWAQIRELNKIGINGTAIYRREGCFTPIE